MNKILNEKSCQKFNNGMKVMEGDECCLKNKMNIQNVKPCQAELEKRIMTDEIIKNEKYYLLRERALIFDKYGKSLFDLNKDYEPKFLLPSNFLERHSLTPETREKMVDWMVEVFSVNKSEPGTLELAVHIMDAYIFSTEKTLKDSDIHLIGLCSIYIASKMEEKIPLRLTHIVNNLGKNTFSKEEIIEMEKDIVKTIEFDFFTAGTYDYLMVFFYDLKVNNYKRLNQLDGKDIVDKFMNFCVFLSKLTLYDYEFVTYRTSLVALSVLSLGFDFLKTNDMIKNIDLKHFLRDWIYYLMNEMKYDPDVIGYVYQRIHELYKYDIDDPQRAYEEGKNCDDVSNLFKLYLDDLL